MAVVAMFATSAALAQDSGFSLKGFGTLGVAHSDSTEADFAGAPTVYQLDGAGRTRQTAFGVDSKIGVQADWKITPNLNLTVQGLSKHRADGSYNPEVEWAFAKYSINSNLDVRVGRIRPAVYLLSDFLDVNFANSWVRPPLEFYASAPITRMEGIDVLWRQSFGDISLLIQPYVGTTEKFDLPSPTDTIQMKKVFGFNAVATTGDFTYRAGYIQTKVTYSAPGLAPVLGALAAICTNFKDPAACAQGPALAPVDKSASFASVGAAYDNGEYFVSTEYGKRATDSMINDGTTYYVSGGARIGKFTPYVTYSAFKNDSPISFTGGTFKGMAGVPLPPTDTVVSGVMLQGAQSMLDQHSLTIGVRFDIAQNIALKAQWDLVETDRINGQAGTGGGMFRRTTDAFNNTDNTVKVISFALDFVF
jgi:hypothetical protein